jgi:hypothetical protein
MPTFSMMARIMCVLELPCATAFTTGVLPTLPCVAAFTRGVPTFLPARSVRMFATDLHPDMPLRDFLVDRAGVSTRFVDRVIELCDDQMIGEVAQLRTAVRLRLQLKTAPAHRGGAAARTQDCASALLPCIPRISYLCLPSLGPTGPPAAARRRPPPRHLPAGGGSGHRGGARRRANGWPRHAARAPAGRQPGSRGAHRPDRRGSHRLLRGEPVL